MLRDKIEEQHTMSCVQNLDTASAPCGFYPLKPELQKLTKESVERSRHFRAFELTELSQNHIVFTLHLA